MAATAFNASRLAFGRMQNIYQSGGIVTRTNLTINYFNKINDNVRLIFYATVSLK